MHIYLCTYVCTSCVCRIASQRAYIMYYSGLRHCWQWVRSWYPVVQYQWRLGRGWSCYHKRELLLRRHGRIGTSSWSNLLIYRYASNGCGYVYVHTYSTYVCIVLAFLTFISAYNSLLIYLCTYLCVNIRTYVMSEVNFLCMYLHLDGNSVILVHIWCLGHLKLSGHLTF